MPIYSVAFQQGHRFVKAYSNSFVSQILFYRLQKDFALVLETLAEIKFIVMFQFSCHMNVNESKFPLAYHCRITLIQSCQLAQKITSNSVLKIHEEYMCD